MIIVIAAQVLEDDHSEVSRQQVSAPEMGEVGQVLSLLPQNLNLTQPTGNSTQLTQDHGLQMVHLHLHNNPS